MPNKTVVLGALVCLGLTHINSSVVAQTSTSSSPEEASSLQGPYQDRSGSDKARMERAQQAFAQAVDAFAQGNFERAAAGFEQAYRLQPSVAAAYNGARSWNLAGYSARAAEAYDRALLQEGTHGRLTAAQRRHALQERRRLRQELSIEQAIKPAAEASAQPTRPASERSARSAQNSFGSAETRAQPSTCCPRLRRAGWAMMGVSAAFLGAGAITGGLGLKSRNDYVDGGRLDASAQARSQHLRLSTNVLWSTAGAALVSAVWLLVRARRKAQSQGAPLGIAAPSQEMKRD